MGAPGANLEMLGRLKVVEICRDIGCAGAVGKSLHYNEGTASRRLWKIISLVKEVVWRHSYCILLENSFMEKMRWKNFWETAGCCVDICRHACKLSPKNCVANAGMRHAWRNPTHETWAGKSRCNAQRGMAMGDN